MALDSQEIFLNFIFYIGFITLIKRILNLLQWIYSTFLRSPKNLISYGSWAMVTGCTDGIGKAMAFNLAEKRLNLVLVGRNASKLDNIKAEIEEKYDIKTTSIVVDLGEMSGVEIERRIKDGIKGLDVGVVFNNAGVAYPYAKFFHELELKMMENVIRVNVEGATSVARAVLPDMISKGKGAIVNVGSASALCLPSYPLYTVYSATKAYLAVFSRSLSFEYEQMGVDIQCQVPLLVATKMTSIKKASLWIPSPTSYSKASLRWVGNGHHTCTPYWPHYMQWCLIQALPHSLLNAVAFRYFVSMRARGLRKDAASSNHQRNNTS